MKQPVYYIANPERKEEYRLETRIWDKDGSLLAEKRPYTPQANQHLDKMCYSYKILKQQKKLANFTQTVKAEKSGNCVYFNYISGKSAERRLIDAIVTGDEKLAKEILDNFLGIVDALPSAELNPASNQQFLKTFGSAYNAKYKCSTLGILDLNLDNFIVDSKGKWHLIDYEWVFDFPIPKDLLVGRFLWWFTVRYQETFKYYADSIKCLNISEDIMIPKLLYTHLKKFSSALTKAPEVENYFRKHVMGGNVTLKPPVDFYIEPKDTKRPLLGAERLVARSNELDKASVRINEMKDKINKLEQQNRDIINSRSYRVVRIVSKAKNKFF